MQHPEFEIVRLTPDAWPRLKAIRLRSLADAPDAFASTLSDTEGLPDSEWRAQLETLATYLAVAGEMDAGIARGVTDRADTEQAWLISMWVEPEMRGQQVGKALVQAVIDWARQSGHKRLLLDVADTNRAAIALYERMGFMPTGEAGSLPTPREHIKEHQRAMDLIR